MDSRRSASFHTGVKEVVASFATDNLPDYSRREKPRTLDIFAPTTGQIRAIPDKGAWTVDLKPGIPSN